MAYDRLRRKIPFPWSPCLRWIAVALVFAWQFSSLAQSTPLTADQLYPIGMATHPPDGIEWSPDGTRLTYINDKGELIGVEGGTGKVQTLISEDKMKSLTPPATSEQDRNIRTRYRVASYFWAPDSKHLLFDSSGQLWFFD